MLDPDLDGANNVVTASIALLDNTGGADADCSNGEADADGPN